jgi:hypothetical protein
MRAMTSGSGDFSKYLKNSCTWWYYQNRAAKTSPRNSINHLAAWLPEQNDIYEPYEILLHLNVSGFLCRQDEET